MDEPADRLLCQCLPLAADLPKPEQPVVIVLADRAGVEPAVEGLSRDPGDGRKLGDVYAERRLDLGDQIGGRQETLGLLALLCRGPFDELDEELVP